MSDAIIRRIDAPGATTRLDALAELLCDSVARGASVNFLAGLAPDRARRFWQGQIPAIAAGTTQLFMAEAAGRLVGTVLLFLAQQPNAPHRAEIGKMLVHGTMRRQGLGRRLLNAAEDAARAQGRTLLMLDTESGSAGEALYRACLWQEMGRVPDHAFRPHGELADTVFFYKVLAPHRAVPG